MKKNIKILIALSILTITSIIFTKNVYIKEDVNKKEIMLCTSSTLEAGNDAYITTLRDENGDTWNVYTDNDMSDLWLDCEVGSFTNDLKENIILNVEILK